MDMTLPADRVYASDDEQMAELRALPFWTAFSLLYLIGLAFLAWRLDSRPGFAYNWESYTLRGLIDFVHQPTWDVLQLNDGLMTTSGRSAVVVGPAWLGFEVFGPSLLGLRFPIVLISAFAVPLTWLLGRRLFSDAVGLTAALLVATSPVFLLYGRTGTVVGISITPALIGFLVLWQCLRRGEAHWRRWLIVFQLVLIASSYFYSVIRFLWLIALVLFAIELVLRGGERRRFLVSLGLTAVALPIAIMIMWPGPLLSPRDAVRQYYSGRGEQIFNIEDNNAALIQFLRIDSEAERQELMQAESDKLIRMLIEQNARDLADLLTDQDTLPAITDYWNPRGRLYPAVLVPLFLIGTIILFWRFFATPKARFMLALFWGFSLPMILTSNVHIGRLIFIVPLLGIVVALPIVPTVRRLVRRQPRRYRPMVQRWAGFAVGAMIVLLGATPNLSDWETPFPRVQMDLIHDQIVSLTQEPPSDQLVFVFGDAGRYEIEGLRVADLEISLHGYLRFVDLHAGVSRGTGPIPLLYGAMLERIDDPASVPGYCTNHYLVDPEAVDRFLELSEPAAMRACGAPLRYDVMVH